MVIPANENIILMRKLFNLFRFNPWNSSPKFCQSFIIIIQKCTVGAAGGQNQILRNLICARAPGFVMRDGNRKVNMEKHINVKTADVKVDKTILPEWSEM